MKLTYVQYQHKERHMNFIHNAYRTQYREETSEVFYAEKPNHKLPISGLILKLAGTINRNSQYEQNDFN